ncbi:single-stranded DNA-binding protein [Nocardiopsis salina]|uniref:single-stranded DNA-binding protein n=1 Tax=Nocardiopsis salina TaxID=245836 RepID=UPI000345D540|nr:single-stranded DNA-binding protein [Nocardiopsis salina]
MALPTLHHTFRLVADPDMRALPSGTPVVNFRLAANTSRKDDNGQWVDGDRFFIRASAFDRTAEAVAEANLRQGDEVTVRGQIKTSEWETPEGEKRSGPELRVYEIARPVRPPRRDNPPRPSPPQQPDPWGAAPSSFANEPPF